MSGNDAFLKKKVIQPQNTKTIETHSCINYHQERTNKRPSRKNYTKVTFSKTIFGSYDR